MAFDIDEIRSELIGGGARPTQFNVLITNKIDGSADRKMQFMCKAASLPASDLGTIELPYFGRKYKIAGDRTFTEWTVTVINDEDFLVRKALENWMGAINAHKANIRNNGATSSPISYKSKAQVNQYGKEGGLIKAYNFEGLYPSQISEIETNWESTDTVEEFTVTFQYDYWTTAELSTDPGIPRVLS